MIKIFQLARYDKFKLYEAITQPKGLRANDLNYKLKKEGIIFIIIIDTYMFTKM